MDGRRHEPLKVAPLAYRSVLAHLLPGAVGLYPVSAYLPILRDVASGNMSSDFSTTLYLIGAALVIGLCLDAIRYMSVDFILNRLFYGQESAQYMRNVRSEADLRFYESVIDSNYAFYQFYTNTALALAAVLMLWHTDSLERPSEGAPVLTGVLMLVLLAAGVRATHGAARRILHRFNASQEKEYDMSNGPGTPIPPPPPPPPPPRKKGEALPESDVEGAKSPSNEEAPRVTDPPPDRQDLEVDTER